MRPPSPVFLVVAGACVQPESPPEPPRTIVPAEPAVVSLDPPRPVGAITTRSRTLAEVQALGAATIAYPGPDGIEHFVPIDYGPGKLVLGFQETDGTWTVGADLDADGALIPAEVLELAGSASGKQAGVLRGSVPRKDGPVSVDLRVSTRVQDGVRVFTLSSETTRQGTLPGGIAFEARSHGGVYDHPSARIVVDEDGDGTPDSANRLVAFTVSDGVLEARGQRWAAELSADGSTLALSPTESPAPGLRAGRPAPPFSVVASDGTTHDLQRYAGAPLLLDFWATWCAPCIALHPQVEALAQRHGLAVLGISADDNQSDLNRWLHRHPTPWPSAAVGPAGPVNTAYGISAWPSHALIDAEGKLVVLGSFEAVRTAVEAGGGVERPR